MLRQITITTFAAFLTCAPGCNRHRDVEQETRELKEAQNQSPEVMKQLQADLDHAKAEVVRLEKKLALARQGITDDVLRERQDVERALHEQERRVQGQVNEAKREAERNERDIANATQPLEQTRPPAGVTAEVQSRSTVQQSPPAAAGTVERQEVIPVRGREEPAPAADAGAPAHP
jgi:predicted RNase H-like nuclease (RuvC/YqgF family)